MTPEDLLRMLIGRTMTRIAEGSARQVKKKIKKEAPKVKRKVMRIQRQANNDAKNMVRKTKRMVAKKASTVSGSMTKRRKR